MKKLTKEMRYMRFVEKLKVPDNPNKCVLWIGAKIGSKKSFYGSFWSGHGHILAHRFSFEHFNNRKIRKGFTIDHQCNNGLCVNPRHLKEMSLRDNILRSEKSACAINARRTHCKSGHRFTPDNTKKHKFGRACRMCANVFMKRYRQKLNSVKGEK